MMKTEERHGRINGSPVRVVYRVQRDLGGEAVRLFVTADKKIWIGYGESPERFSHVGDATNGTSRDAVCEAANCW